MIAALIAWRRCSALAEAERTRPPEGYVAAYLPALPDCIGCGRHRFRVGHPTLCRRCAILDGAGFALPDPSPPKEATR